LANSSLWKRLSLTLVPPLAAILMRATRRTMRLTHVGRETVERRLAQRRPYIHAFWHGHMFLMPYAYMGRRIAIMISEHQDGELIARTMKRFGHESIRGSTTSGGASALRAAVRALRQGCDVGITPDGPRGPRHRVQPGVIQVARLSGAAIVPVAFAASRRKVFGSWDAFTVPYPFSRGVFVYGEPIEVPVHAGKELMESARRELERSLQDLSVKAGALAGGAVLAAAHVGERHV
jgi:hypothetical protein